MSINKFDVGWFTGLVVMAIMDKIPHTTTGLIISLLLSVIGYSFGYSISKTRP